MVLKIKKVQAIEKTLFCRPAGVFEFEKFANGTKALMDAVVALTENGGTTIIGRNHTSQQCGGSGSGIRIFIVSWIRDKDPESQPIFLRA
jgi:3-phosphoglycerate kinase